MIIKVFLVDVDGTLTDGVYQMDEQGVVRKNFHTRDFHGMWRLSQSGVQIGIITYASDEVIEHQCRRGAKYAKVMKGAKDKLATIQNNYVDCRDGVKWENICYIGDDVLDAELMDEAGIAACPSDADPAILKLVEARPLGDHYLCKVPGGKGCVREFADYILERNARIRDARLMWEERV